MTLDPEEQGRAHFYAIVALDNLGAPSVPTSGNLSVKPCPSNPTSHDPAPITKPPIQIHPTKGLTMALIVALVPSCS